MSTSNSDGLRQCYTRHPLCSIIKKISNSIPPFTKLQEEQWAWRPPFSVVERLAWEASGFKYPGIYQAPTLPCPAVGLSILLNVSQSGRMKTRSRCLVIFLCSILQLIGIALFARGFFPYKKVLPGFAKENTPDKYEQLGLLPAPRPEKQFDRLVFVVIDALRRLLYKQRQF